MGFNNFFGGSNLKMKKNNKWIKISIFACVGLVVSLISVFGILNRNNVINTSNSNKPKTEISSSAIPISMALDDGYLYPTIVAMTSILENAYAETKYDFYVMHPGEFTENSKNKLMSLENKYPRCKINLIDMENKFKNAYDVGHITTPTYYRLCLSELLPDIDKIIWLDGDTLTFKDLHDMYNIDMEGYYYRGFLDPNVNGAKKFVEDNDHYICAGVMLINLSELRKDNMVPKFEKFIEENNDNLDQHDQTTINAMAYKKIGKLDPKFGTFNFQQGAISAKYYPCRLIAKDKYTQEEMVEAFNDLYVLHCINKPWKEKQAFGATEWWNYAKMTDFYDEIEAKYPIL